MSKVPGSDKRLLEPFSRFGKKKYTKFIETDFYKKIKINKICRKNVSSRVCGQKWDVSPQLFGRSKGLFTE